MGMGYGANYAQTVSDEFVKEICPEEHKAFFELIEKYKLPVEHIARNWNFVDFNDLCEYFDENLSDGEVNEAVEKLNTASADLESVFKERTGGLLLGMDEHDSSEEGDRYDDVDGWFWTVDGVYQRTPAGEKFKDQISEVGFVRFG